MKTSSCIMLIDDNPDDNFFHERAIKKYNETTSIITEESGISALEYLRSAKNKNVSHPDIIFLDINMPRMNGWEFLAEYNKLDKELQSKAIVIMLTTSENPEDEAKAKKWSIVSDYITKPLTMEIIEKIIKKFGDVVI